VRTRFLIAVAIIVTVLTYLVFTPSRFFSKHFETNYNSTRFYCGATDVEVTTASSGASIVINYFEYDVDGMAVTKTVELFYSGSALFSDYYQAKTAEIAEYDGELKLDDFGGGVGGTCL
jgi:hypothetical protein